MQTPSGEWVKDCLRHSEFFGRKLLYKLIWSFVFFFPHPRSARQNWKELLPSLMGENETLYWPLSEKLKISLFPASVPNPMTLISRSETKILFLLFFILGLWRVPKWHCDGLMIISLLWQGQALGVRGNSIKPTRWFAQSHLLHSSDKQRPPPSWSWRAESSSGLNPSQDS